jgi:four helix bundle protein
MGNKVSSFLELDVYKRLYKAMLDVHKSILTVLPNEEKYGLGDQMRRCSKAPLAIIAEGYSKRHHKKDWTKYLNDALGECNEMIVHLNCCKDLYLNLIDKNTIYNLIQDYDIGGKQLYRLAQNWK